MVLNVCRVGLGIIINWKSADASLPCEGISILVLGKGEHFLPRWVWRGQWHEAFLRGQDCHRVWTPASCQFSPTLSSSENWTPLLIYHNSFWIPQSNFIFEFHSFSCVPCAYKIRMFLGIKLLFISALSVHSSQILKSRGRVLADNFINISWEKDFS